MFGLAKILSSTFLSGSKGFFDDSGVYTEAEPTSEMMDIIIQIMVEVVSILGIATKEIKESRLSKYFYINI